MKILVKPVIEYKICQKDIVENHLKIQVLAKSLN